ncbi:hypothetical protein GCM10010528_16350 [Gordonia defluvii]|uniref:Uncharacterized protein n=1 Tax=Gordonia defluvii TaxID=283718 RepID=A0ABP6LA78_9ACTN
METVLQKHREAEVEHGRAGAGDDEPDDCRSQTDIVGHFLRPLERQLDRCRNMGVVVAPTGEHFVGTHGFWHQTTLGDQ